MKYIFNFSSFPLVPGVLFVLSRGREAHFFPVCAGLVGATLQVSTSPATLDSITAGSLMSLLTQKTFAYFELLPRNFDFNVVFPQLNLTS